jgi:pteridine reductase
LGSTGDVKDDVALVTGSAKRVGASLVRALHAKGFRVIVHYRSAAAEARILVDELNANRADSAKACCADFMQSDEVEKLARESVACFGRLDLLVHNASAFFPTPLAEATPLQWEELMTSNAKAPYFLSKALATELAQRKGSIINLVDIYAERPMRNHSIYCMAKSALRSMTLSLARELAPNVRVNAIAPGAILWPENENPTRQEKILAQTPLERAGSVEDLIGALLFLACEAPFITGQILTVDGGRSLSW